MVRLNKAFTVSLSALIPLAVATPVYAEWATFQHP